MPARSKKHSAAARKNGAKGGRKLLGMGTKVGNRRLEAKATREEAQAIREQTKALRECGELCYRAEATAELSRLTGLVRTHIDRATAYLDPGLTPEVRTEAEKAIRTAMTRLRTALGEAARKGSTHGR